jgi:eukaryotic-like serine/threonine-protein kinase
MKSLSNATLAHLREVADLPDVSSTRYEIVEAIGSGGMGTVYRARDRELDRLVALKVLRVPELTADGDMADRLLVEARILAKLEHPAIVPVHDAGRLPDGRVFYAMKLVQGARLDEYARGPASLIDRLRVFERVCEAVAFAHAQGVVHRDLKPANVMVGRFGEVLVMDWGVAKVLAATHDAPAANDHASSLALARVGGETHDGAVLGTPGYMAPEQERGQVGRIDERTDVFALGTILRDLLAASTREQAVPKPLAAIARKARAVDPGARYTSVDLLRADVGRFVAGLSVTALPERLADRLARFARNYRAAIVLVLAYLAMRLLLLLWTRV